MTRPRGDGVTCETWRPQAAMAMGRWPGRAPDHRHQRYCRWGQDEASRCTSADDHDGGIQLPGRLRNHYHCPRLDDRRTVYDIGTHNNLAANHYCPANDDRPGRALDRVLHRPGG
jgi:hypothetical protein